jgi:hypothetical protein
MRRIVWLVLSLAVGFMSGILSIAREVLSFWQPQKFTESRLLSASLFFACCISFGLAWWIEHRDRSRIEGEKRKLEEGLEDRSPRVAGELFVSDGEFRVKLNNTLPRGYKVPVP